MQAPHPVCGPGHPLSVALYLDDDQEVQRLLCEDPSLIHARVDDMSTLAAALFFKSPRVVRLLLQRAPTLLEDDVIEGLFDGTEATLDAVARTVPDVMRLPSFFKAYIKCVQLGRVTLMQHFIQLVPDLPTRLDPEGRTSLHVAADHTSHTHPPVVELLTRRAPQAAAMRDPRGHTPLEAFLVAFPSLHASSNNSLEESLMMTSYEVRPLLRHTPDAFNIVATKLPGLVRYLCPWLVELGPMGPEQWAAVPGNNARLVRTLPCVLARSTDEAKLLVERLPEWYASRIRAGIMALCTQANRRRMHIPSDIVHRIVGLAGPRSRAGRW